MARRGANHTPIGKKISALAKNQAELAQLLGLTQQSISGKMTGKIAVTLKDLEKLSEHYRVPVTYFVSGEHITPALACAWEETLNGPPETQQAVEILSSLPRPFAQMLLQTLKAMQNTASYYTNEHLQEIDYKMSRRESSASGDSTVPEQASALPSE